MTESQADKLHDGDLTMQTHRKNKGRINFVRRSLKCFGVVVNMVLTRSTQSHLTDSPHYRGCFKVVVKVSEINPLRCKETFFLYMKIQNIYSFQSVVYSLPSISVFSFP